MVYHREKDVTGTSWAVQPFGAVYTGFTMGEHYRRTEAAQTITIEPYWDLFDASAYIGPWPCNVGQALTFQLFSAGNPMGYPLTFSKGQRGIRGSFVYSASSSAANYVFPADKSFLIGWKWGFAHCNLVQDLGSDGHFNYAGQWHNTEHEFNAFLYYDGFRY